MRKFFWLLPLILVVFILSFSPVKAFSLLDLFKSDSQTPAQYQSAPAEECGLTDTANWCQVARTPQRTGYTPEVLGTNFQVAWTYPFQSERVHPQVQAIVYQGKVFVGTEMGHLYAINATTGQKVWQFPASGSIGPILASVAVENGMVFVSSMDGAVYALNANSGVQIWKQQLSNSLGFSTAPLLAESKVMLGGRNGYFYALNQNDGQILWQQKIGSPILQTAAFNGGRVVVGAMNLKIYSLNISDGSIAWNSQIKGMALKEYWPLITQGKIIAVPLPSKQNCGIQPGFPFSWLDPVANKDWLIANGPKIASGNLTQVADIMNAQTTVMNQYLANPQNFYETIFVLDETTGQKLPSFPHVYARTHNGAMSPPCVDREGKLVIPLLFISGGWGRTDLSTNRYIDFLYDGFDWNNQPYQSGNPAGFGNDDENYAVTCTGNFIFAFHVFEWNGHYNGVFNQDTRRWQQINRATTNNQMFNNTQSGGTNQVTVANGRIYHISVHELVARTTN